MAAGCSPSYNRCNPAPPRRAMLCSLWCARPPHSRHSRGQQVMAPPPRAPRAPPPTRCVQLRPQHEEHTLLRFSKGTRLRLSAGAALLGRRLTLYTNYPDEGAPFERSRYRALQWRGGPGLQQGPASASLLVADDDCCVDLLLQRAGAYHYYFIYDDTDSGAGAGPAGSGWFQVEPTLHAGGQPLPLDAVCLQTMVTRCLGPLARWERVLGAALDARFNMVHVTPVQALGGSGSAYCIADQLQPAASLAVLAWDELEALAARLRDRGLLLVSDVVLNHTANETPWLGEHPDATYNCANCPHLRPAALLDALVARVAADAAQGRVPNVQPAALDDAALRAAVDEVVRRAQDAHLEQCYQCDAGALQAHFVSLARGRLPAVEGGAAGALALQPDPQRRRLRATVDMELALRLYNVRREHAPDEEARLQACALELRRALDALNAAAAADMARHLQAAADNLLAGARYERTATDGPRLGALTPAQPLFPHYFAWPASGGSGDRGTEEALVWDAAGGALVRAHNGWVMDADPLEDFAAPAGEGRVYLRRELIPWGDSVKLRYGARAEDSPFLWRHMTQYVQLTAELFAGVRLDNCHSTPLHVAEHMLDAARAVNPELYVLAELFTNAPHVDNLYVNRLGITALIREAQSAWDAHEQGRLVHRFGGRPVGAFERLGTRAAVGRLPRALLMDQTHDNPPALTRRSVRDLLPTAALTAMACCAAGSTRGYDELVPHAVSVVSERRLYSDATSHPLADARAAINELHAELARAGYSEVFVDQMTPDVVAVTRHEPRTRSSLIMVAATAFSAHSRHYTVPPLRLEGELEEVVLEGCVQWAGPGDEPAQPAAAHVPHADTINGLAGWCCELRRRLQLVDSAWLCAPTQDGHVTELSWRGALPAGAVVVVRVRPNATARAALQQLQPLLGPADEDPLGVRAALEPLRLVEYHALLYRCEQEERECGGGCYTVPGHGALTFAGLQGAATLLEQLRPQDDLGHALCAHLRAGDWLLEHTWRRLEREPALRVLHERYRAVLQPLAALPRFLQPHYVDALLARLLHAVQSAALQRMGGAALGGPMARALALCSLQLVGVLPSAPLPAPPPLPPARGSLAAGLPHFATGYMRCWGRDTFVALRGLLLLPRRWAQARAHLLGYAACLRHGLLPNLLDGGLKARYNSRDAVWWWLHALQAYCGAAPDGPQLLHAPVPRLFPTDDAPAPEPGASLIVQPLHQLVQEVLQAHFEGRVFRERGAGPALDAHMADEGFTVRIGVAPDTGFVVGGSEHNCGTWMDKMGSSERAGTRGQPATPRDGAAVELVALSHAALEWLHAEHAAGRYPHGGVSRPAAGGGTTAWTWRQWADRIHRHFEPHYWVGPQPSGAPSEQRPDLVHRRNMYKDTVGATRPWADYQLRCNYLLAMAASPALFVPAHAWAALDTARRLLLTPAGFVRTLDPADYNYRPHYDPADDGPDPATAHGYNYHQGPAWLWPLGAYLRAVLHFGRATNQGGAARAHALQALAALRAHLDASPWRALPELDSAAGCGAQAWSCATVLEALHALQPVDD